MSNRTRAEIRNEIMKSLRKRPMSTWEIRNDTEINVNTVKRHLEALEALNVVHQEDYNWRGNKIRMWTFGKAKKIFIPIFVNKYL